MPYSPGDKLAHVKEGVSSEFVDLLPPKSAQPNLFDSREPELLPGQCVAMRLQ